MEEIITPLSIRKAQIEKLIGGLEQTLKSEESGRWRIVLPPPGIGFVGIKERFVDARVNLEYMAKIKEYRHAKFLPKTQPESTSYEERMASVHVIFQGKEEGVYVKRGNLKMPNVLSRQAYSAGNFVLSLTPEQFMRIAGDYARIDRFLTENSAKKPFDINGARIYTLKEEF